MPPEKKSAAASAAAAASSAAAEEADLLNKQIRTARTVLLIIAVATLVSALLLIPQLAGAHYLENVLITAAVSVVYFILAVQTKKKPYTAIRLGLLVLLLVILLDIFWNPFGPYSRWQTKALTFLLLLLGIGDAKDAQRKLKMR